jgi:hypothetical protein
MGSIFVGRIFSFATSSHSAMTEGELSADFRWSLGVVKKEVQIPYRGESLIFKVGNPLGFWSFSLTWPTN